MERSGPGAKYLLLVQEDKVRGASSPSPISLLENHRKRHLSRDDPEPQLIAEAMAALHENNKARGAAGLPKHQSKTFAGITMVGTAPTLYKLPVTDQILVSLATSQYPPQVTTVHKLVPPVPFPERLPHEGMRPLVNRRIILQCFEAFKQFVVSASVSVPYFYHLTITGRELTGLKASISSSNDRILNEVCCVVDRSRLSVTSVYAHFICNVVNTCIMHGLKAEI